MHTIEPPDRPGIVEKLWGWSQQIVDLPDLHVFTCRGILGGYCSKHLHQYKANTFAVWQGTLAVCHYSEGHWVRTILMPETQRTITIPPGVLHQFTVLSETCRFWEVYEAPGHGPLDVDDIIRLTGGGRHLGGVRA